MFNLLKNMKTEDLEQHLHNYETVIANNSANHTEDYLDFCGKMIEEIAKELEARKVKRIIPLFTGEFYVYYVDIENWMAGKGQY